MSPPSISRMLPRTLRDALKGSRTAQRLRLKYGAPFAPVAGLPLGKEAKLRRIEPLLKPHARYTRTAVYYDFLTPQLQREHNIVETDNVSGHGYDPIALEIIDSLPNGMILDCGAGLRDTYYDNVVNFELCPYLSTDVRGVAESLPFKDGSFDAVFSLAVLEHVRQPWQAAAEISRVLKPGGRLYCVVPFLQPYHGYPHHYFNMTMNGLGSLFERDFVIDEQTVAPSGFPIWMLAWVVHRWMTALPPDAQESFRRVSLGEIFAESDPGVFLGRDWVADLPPDARADLASTTMLLAHKT